MSSVLGIKYELKELRMNVYDMVWRSWTSDNERHWRRFELYDRDLRIGNLFSFESNCESNRRLRCEFESTIESNQDVVVYVFNADCHRSCVGLLRTTGNYPTACQVVM